MEQFWRRENSLKLRSPSLSNYRHLPFQLHYFQILISALRSSFNHVTATKSNTWWQTRDISFHVVDSITIPCCLDATIIADDIKTAWNLPFKLNKWPWLKWQRAPLFLYRRRKPFKNLIWGSDHKKTARYECDPSATVLFMRVLSGATRPAAPHFFHFLFLSVEIPTQGWTAKDASLGGPGFDHWKKKPPTT